ncbi:hypothetical protein [Serpentinicella alkaliphila]|nr:hypothetical protein [Serpentinicella alkaliphila]
MEDPQAIGIAFKKLTPYPGIDTNVHCVEWYIGDTDVTWMKARRLN